MVGPVYGPAMAAKAFTLITPLLGTGPMVNATSAPATSKTVTWSGATRRSRWVLEASPDGAEPWGAVAVFNGAAGSMNLSTNLDFFRLVRLDGTGGTVELTGSDDVATPGVDGVDGKDGGVAFIVAGDSSGEAAARSAVGARVGDTVDSVVRGDTFADVSANFAATTGAGTISQVSGDLTGINCLAGLRRA